MRAALFHRTGGPDVLQVEEVPRPKPGPHEVLIAVRAAGLNHLDLWVRRGLPIETTMPHIGGSDLAGEIVEIGSEVQGWRTDDRVLANPLLSCDRCPACREGHESLCERIRVVGEHTNGGFAEYAVVPARNVHRLPDTIPFATAAAFPVSYQTAWRALMTRARLREGHDVLVLGASGGTAIAAVQIAKLVGARVFAVTNGERKVEKVRALGADAVYDRSMVDFSREVHAATGKRGVDIVIENVGEATWPGSVRALARGGRLVTYGATTGYRASIDLRLLFWKQLELIGTTMASRAEFAAVLQQFFQAKLNPVIDSVLPLDRVREAHERLESGEHFGKIILVP